ncbi:MAG: OB-fold domain-containing protein [Acidimicrobiia bacterium]|nr:OB-fold domain-containing protein [Acidimicrobiia bacterium]
MTEATSPYLAPGLPAPRPVRDGLDEPYWSGARRHELWVQRCPSCGTHQWGPEWMCHACQRFDPDWVQVEGRGRIFSWQRPHHPVHPALADQGPYVVVLVELPHADRIRMIGNLLGDPLQAIEIGSDVDAVFEDHDDADPPFTLVQWRAR